MPEAETITSPASLDHALPCTWSYISHNFYDLIKSPLKRIYNLPFIVLLVAWCSRGFNVAIAFQWLGAENTDPWCYQYLRQQHKPLWKAHSYKHKRWSTFHWQCLVEHTEDPLGLRELCSKSSSLFYSEFPQKLYHYAHYYSQNLLIILIILNFTAILFQLFFTFAIKMCNNTL